ncbi:hypothetical protein U9M48_036552 [Paspalum notatum var. saurae]|uniref:Reverse transcriptase domain-containing protein n=1 Tax=Paspalum notatum var. saurae TaxID=547442 RepID=A0AAQ3XA78_PASNO
MRGKHPTDNPKMDGQFLVDGGLLILHYADDTILILFTDHDLDKACNLKLLLFAFEHALVLKINFHESELYCFGTALDNLELYIKFFGCKARNFLINLVGLPLRRDLVVGKGNISQSEVPSFVHDIFVFHTQGSTQEVGLLHSRLFGKGTKTKYKLAKWTILCQRKDKEIQIHNNKGSSEFFFSEHILPESRRQLFGPNLDAWNALLSHIQGLALP